MSSATSNNVDEEWHTPQRVRVRSLRFDAGTTYHAIEKQTGIPETSCRDIVKASSSRRNTHVPD